MARGISVRWNVMAEEDVTAMDELGRVDVLINYFQLETLLSETNIRVF